VRRSPARHLTIVLSLLLVFTAVGAARPAATDAYCDPVYQTCLITSRDYVMPGWYPAIEGALIWTVAAGATYLYGRYGRWSAPWYVKAGGGASWSIITALLSSSKYYAGDRIVERTYETRTAWVFYQYHYRNGVLIESHSRTHGKSKCAAVNNFARGIITGQIAAYSGGHYKFYCATGP
jgi:hypothetical protein